MGLNVIVHAEISIDSYKALIINIGGDVNLDDEEGTTLDLLDIIVILDYIIKAFAPMFGCYTSVNQNMRDKEKVFERGNF